jgi:hypothetical protein
MKDQISSTNVPEDDLIRMASQLRAELQQLAGAVESVWSLASRLEGLLEAQTESQPVAPPAEASETPAAIDEPAVDPEAEAAARDQVRRAVEQARQELGRTEMEPPAPVEAVATPDTEATSPEPAPVDSEATREEVRRAVEQARAEMAAGILRDSDTTETPHAADGEQPEAGAESAAKKTLSSRFADLMPRDRPWLPEPEKEFVAPGANIVVDGGETRLELVQVYELLGRVGVSDGATLLNYTPHSVTVSLSGGQMPDQEAVTRAARSIFGREPEVGLEGNKLSIRLGVRKSQAA